MKKIFYSVLAGSLLATAAAWAISGYEPLLTRRDPTNTFNQALFTPIPSSDASGLLVYDGKGVPGDDGWTRIANIGTGLSYDAATNTVSASFTPSVPTVTNGVSRPINGTAFQPSATKFTTACYNVSIAPTLSLTGGQDGYIALESAATSGGTYAEISRARNGNTGTLTLGLNISQPATFNLCGAIEAGYYARMRSVSVTGSPTFAYVTGQEVNW